MRFRFSGKNFDAAPAAPAQASTQLTFLKKTRVWTIFYRKSKKLFVCDNFDNPPILNISFGARAARRYGSGSTNIHNAAPTPQHWLSNMISVYGLIKTFTAIFVDNFSLFSSYFEHILKAVESGCCSLLSCYSFQQYS
jgi:hypothetical protein